MPISSTFRKRRPKGYSDGIGRGAQSLRALSALPPRGVFAMNEFTKTRLAFISSGAVGAE